MSELIAEARVLVTPDTAGFRALLIKEVAVASKGVVVPIPVTPVVEGGTGALAGQQAALKGVNAELEKGAQTAKSNAQAIRDDAKAIREHQRQLGGLSRGAGSAALSMVGLRGATLAATAPFLAGAVAAVTFAKSIGLAAEFTKQLAVLQATSGATSDQLAQVAEAAKALGADVALPGVSAIDAAQAMTELSKAGLSVQESIDGARGVLQLATAAGIDNAAATELAASALNAFGLAGSDATKVADVLANSANAAQGSISDIGLALQQSAAAGRQAGLTLQETVGILTEFARAGIKGSDAGTSLRVLLLRLINPSKQASEVIKELGLHIRDATGNINLGFFDEFARKTANLTRAERDRDAAIIAGQDAFRGLAILSRTGGVALQQQIDQLDKSGTAADLAAARMTGLSGAVENLKNQLSTVGLSIGQSLTPSLTEIVSGAGVAVSALGDVIEEVKNLKAAAEQPIDFIINVIPQGAGGGEGGAFDTIKQDLTDLVTKPLPGLIFLSRAQKEAAKETANFNAAVLKSALPKLVDDLNKVKGSSSGLDTFVRKLKDTSDELKGGSAETEAFRKSFDAFITQIQNRSGKPITIPITLPPGLLDGTLGADAAQATGAGFANQLKNEDFGFSGFVASVDLDKEGSDAAKLFGAAWAKALPKAMQPASGSALGGLDLAVAQATGTTDQQLSILRGQQAKQQAFLDAVLARPQTAANVDLAKKAADNLKQTNAAIKAITDARQAAAKQVSDAADATKKANQDAAAKTKAANDAAFLTAQEDARGRQQRLIGLAGDTEGLADDIKRQQGLRVLITKQITAIRESALAEDAKRTAIKALAKARQATTDTINQLAATDRQQRQAQKQEAAETLAAAQLELAQTTFDLTGAKAPLERAFDSEIKRQIRLKNAAKKGSVAFLEAQTAIRRLLKQKKDLNDEVADAAKEQGLTGGTSLVDLFNENQRIFDQIGNVGQSAAGLTTHAQNANISAIVQHQIQFGGSPAATAQQKATDALTRAIVELTNKLGGQGNFSLGVPAPGTGPVISRSQALAEEQRFFYQKQAKAMVEQGLG